MYSVQAIKVAPVITDADITVAAINVMILSFVFIVLVC